MFNSVYAYAEARQLAQANVVVYPGTGGESTPQLEYLKAAMFSAGAPDGLLPAELELAERLIAVLRRISRSPRRPRPSWPYWTDLAQAMTPARTSRAPQPGPGLRYLGPGAALAEVHEHAESLRRAASRRRSWAWRRATRRGWRSRCCATSILYWSPQAPERKTQRHAVKSRLSVAYGYDGVVGVLGGADSLDFDHRNAESWIVENVSAGGFGAVVPQTQGRLAARRRAARAAARGRQQLGAGRGAPGEQDRRAAGARRHRNAVQGAVAVEFAVSGVASASEQGVLLKDGDGAETRIVLKPGVFAPAQNLEIARGGRHHVYMPQAVAEHGEDYEIARFREMVRES